MEKPIRSWQVFGISVVLALIWLTVISLSFSAYQQTRISDPLAEIKVLLPGFYVVTILFAFLCIYVFWKRIGNKWLHLALLFEFALMLWWTPYFLSGFVREPDGLWYAGISENIGSILNGPHYILSDYAFRYPSSFLFNKCVMAVTGTEAMDYSAWLFPLLYLFLFIVLWYTFARKFMDGHSSFLSGILAIPVLHYMKLHPAPQTVGMLLIFLALLLIIVRKDIRSRVLGILSFSIMVITHPVSPVLALIFIAVAGLYIVIEKRAVIFKRWKLVLGLAIGCLVLIVAFLAFTNIGNYFLLTIERMMGNPMDQGFTTVSKYIFGSPFIYQEIYIISELIYIGYAMAALLLLALLLRLQSKSSIKGLRKKMVEGLKRVGYRNFTLLGAAVLSLILMLPFAASDLYVLLERGLTFFLLFSSLFIASRIVEARKNRTKYRYRISRRNARFLCRAAGIGLVLALVLTYPVVAYSIDMYNSYPPSEGLGMEFLVGHVKMKNETIMMGSLGQLYAYMIPYELRLTRFPYTLQPIYSEPGIAVYRHTFYCYVSMRHNLTFVDNDYSLAYERIDHSSEFDKVYVSSTVRIYLRNNLPS